MSESIIMTLGFSDGGSGLVRIFALTVVMTVLSTAIATLLGIPTGVLLASVNFPGKRLIRRVIQTFMSLPPVVAGLFVFLLLSRQGPLGSLNLLFSLPAMIIAQVILIFPIITSLTLSAVEAKRPLMYDTITGLGLGRKKEFILVIWECRLPLIVVILSGFGRAVSEVGAVMMVGGNIADKTRVMTTAIMLETSKGNFNGAIVLGLVLLVLSFGVNIIAVNLQEERHV
jgi:tungstate transport system permease protein